MGINHIIDRHKERLQSTRSRFVCALLSFACLALPALNSVAKASELAKESAIAHNNEEISCNTRLIKQNPEDAEAYFRRAYAYQGLRKYPNAISDYSSAIRINPNSVDAHSYRALVYSMAHCPKKAILDYTKLIGLKPQNPTYYLNRALCYSRLKRFAQSLEDCSAAIAIEKTYGAYAQRAEVYDKLGKHELAEQDRQEADKMPANGTIINR